MNIRINLVGGTYDGIRKNGKPKQPYRTKKEEVRKRCLRVQGCRRLWATKRKSVDTCLIQSGVPKISHWDVRGKKWEDV